MPFTPTLTTIPEKQQPCVKEKLQQYYAQLTDKYKDYYSVQITSFMLNIMLLLLLSLFANKPETPNENLFIGKKYIPAKIKR